MRLTSISIILLCASASCANAQVFKKDGTVGSIMIDSAERKRNVLNGMAQALSQKYPKLKISEFTKCLEEYADLPANWTKDIAPFAAECAEKFATR